MSIKLVCSTGTIVNKEAMYNLKTLYNHVEQVENKLMEFIVYPVWYEHMESIADTLLKMGKEFPVFHSEKKIGEYFCTEDKDVLDSKIDEFKKNCEFANMLNSERIVLHLWETPYSDEKIDKNIEVAVLCSEIAKQHSLILSIETIPCKVSTPISVLNRIREKGIDCSFTLDTKHIAKHDEIDRIYEDWLWDIEYPVPNFHFRDYIKGMPYNLSLHPGEGNIDFTKLVKYISNREEMIYVTLEATGVEWEGKVFIQKVNETIKNLKNMTL